MNNFLANIGERFQTLATKSVCVTLINGENEFEVYLEQKTESHNKKELPNHKRWLMRVWISCPGKSRAMIP